MTFAEQYPPWDREPTGEGIGYMLRTCGPKGESAYGYVSTGFVWPESGYVAEARFDHRQYNGPGLYGLLNGIGDWTLLPYFNGHARWQILAVRESECVLTDLGGAHKAPRGWLVYSGNAIGAMHLFHPILAKALKGAEQFPSEPEAGLLGHVVAHGPDGAISRERHGAAIGFHGHAESWGPHAAAITFGICKRAFARGHFAHAIACRDNSVAAAYGQKGNAVVIEDCSHAYSQGGGRSAAVALGWKSRAIARNGIAAALGEEGVARAESGGAIFLAELFGSRVIATFSSLVGQNGIEAGKAYTLRNGRPIEVAE